MKNSKEFRDWQNDLTYLSCTYNTNPAPESYQHEDVLRQIVSAAELLPRIIRKQMDHHSGESMKQFLDSTADSLFEVCRLLQLALSLKLISMDEYHNLMEDINDIGVLLDNFIDQHNPGKKNEEQPALPEDVAYWVLN